LAFLESQGHRVEGVFCNPNIYPQKEHDKRWQVFRDWAKIAGLSAKRLDMSYEQWKGSLGENLLKPQRCLECYRVRLGAVAEMARREGFDCFSTTLLVSPYQDHEGIRAVMEEMSRKYEIPHLYRDFRPGYRRSRDMARGRHLYMQKYCGCQYSLGGEVVNGH
jgi:predicted adenine nucleotide alpha hydrolase (AANH) superfamily ATPase